MKIATILKITLVLAITTGLYASSAVSFSPNPDQFKYEVPAFSKSSNIQVVKAIMIDGEAVPLIELPVVEINAQAGRDNLVRGELINGKVVPSILLDEIVITPNS